MSVGSAGCRHFTSAHRESLISREFWFRHRSIIHSCRLPSHADHSYKLFTSPEACAPSRHQPCYQPQWAVPTTSRLANPDQIEPSMMASRLKYARGPFKIQGDGVRPRCCWARDGGYIYMRSWGSFEESERPNLTSDMQMLVML
jgi:hypothetical protein